MPKTCGECPWGKPSSDSFDLIACSVMDALAEIDTPVCTARRAFEVLRDEVRRLRDDMFHLVKERDSLDEALQAALAEAPR